MAGATQKLAMDIELVSAMITSISVLHHLCTSDSSWVDDVSEY